jgi:predicted O-linked N-acetylglucosamine transferase (SPINDLY family)
MDALFQGILEADPAAKIVFIEGINPTWHHTLASRWEAAMGSTLAGRMCVVPRMNPEDFIGFQAMADVLLDTTVFGGGNTSLEAFSMGIPIITMPGPYGKGRVTDAWYQMMDIQDCTASHPQDYIDKALRAVCDREYRNSLRQRILSKKSVLFNNTQGIQEFEAWLSSRYESDILGGKGGLQ